MSAFGIMLSKRPVRVVVFVVPHSYLVEEHAGKTAQPKLKTRPARRLRT